MSLVQTNNPAEISFRDAGNEVSAFRVFGTVLTAANAVAKEALWSTLVTAAEALALGTPVHERYLNDEIYSYDLPTNGAARELKLLVQYIDATTSKRLTCTLPTLDPTIPAYVANINARDVVQIDTPDAITGFIAAFNAFVVNPETGNACTVIGLKVVGRNN